MDDKVDIPPNYHLGHLLFEHLSRHGDQYVCQIDAATGDEESYASVLKRSIKLAKALRAFGAKPGDVVAIGGPNHLDLCIPFYAALFNGHTITGVDPYYKYDELRTLLKLTSPKIAFCQHKSYETYAQAAGGLGQDVKLVTFDKGDCTMQRFIDMYYKPDGDEDFKIAEFDQDKVYAYLVTTSGTTSNVKVAAFKHRTLLLKQIWFDKIQPPRKPTGHTNKKTLVLSPINWISKYFILTSHPAEGVTTLQTSFPDSLDHIIDIINKYRPEVTLASPLLTACLLARKDEVDLTCFESIAISGSKLYQDVLQEFKKLVAKNCIVREAYGQTETIGPILGPNPFGPPGNCGVPLDGYIIKLVDPETAMEIKEANVTGEIYVKGLGFSEYYNDPEETAEAFTEDGFYKTGDLLYRDEQNNYYFVDRTKALIKCRDALIIPAELEEVIVRHPGVKEVCVVGIEDPVDGQRPLAAVVRHPGSDVTAQEIQDLVTRNVSIQKQLSGGVLFFDSLPYTSTRKLSRKKIKELAISVLSKSQS